MSLRTKLLLLFIALGILPALAVLVLSYYTAASAVEALLRAEAQTRADRIAEKVETKLAAYEKRLAELSSGKSLIEYVRESPPTPVGAIEASHPIPDTVRAHLGAYFMNSHGHFEMITCLGPSRQILFRVLPSNIPGGEPIFQVKDIDPTNLRVENRVWEATNADPLRAPIGQSGDGASLQTSVAILDDERRNAGALVLEVKLREVLEEANQDGSSPRSQAPGSQHPSVPPVVVALDNKAGRLVYHTKVAFKYQPASTAMPYFESIAAKMQAGGEGQDSFKTNEGDRLLVAFRQVQELNVSVAVAENYDFAVAGMKRSSLLGGAISLLAGALALAALVVLAGRTSRRIERVAAGASAIANGDLNQRIEVDTGDETRTLAESFNLMSDRLCELIRREAESKQFESFMRLSAMLTHDLKNAITGLSMLVSNMDRHMHREDFREDAIFSLREATDKLKRIVSRLTEPVRSLSGEYRRDARATDLIPIIRRVLAVNAEPSAPLYDIETNLPDSLVAVVESDRIENVIENLVINALEAMGAVGGRLTVEAGQEGEKLVFINIADTGPGMDEDFIKLRLFRPFSTTKQNGIGLGLFTCREIVEAHGGRLQVESKPGTGTQFRVVLPSRLFASGERSRRPSEGTNAD